MPLNLPIFGGRRWPGPPQDGGPHGFITARWHNTAMEIPDLVRDRLGGEDVTAGVNLGDEDALCLTPSKTIVYKGEGLLSDESVSVFPHNVERLTVSEGRRKAKFQFAYVDGTRSFTVPVSRSEPVLELVLEAMLREDGVADPDESVEGVFRFSELAVVITESRLVKHIGTAVWDEDFEEFPFADVTGLSFEQGSVATQIVLAVDGRPQRIKAPNDQAPVVRRTLEEALYEFHDVASLEELNATLGSDDEEPESPDRGAGFGLEDDIDPLVGGEDEEAVDAGDDDIETMETVDEGEGLRPSSMDVDPTSGGQADADGAETDDAETGDDSAGEPATEGDERADAGAAESEAAEGGGSAGDDSAGPPSATGERSDAAAAGSDPAAGAEAGAPAGPAEASLGQAEIEALETELADLRETVEAQNEVLKKQHDAIKRLIAELRSD